MGVRWRGRVVIIFRVMSGILPIDDGFVKSPSAALRFTFVVAAYLKVRFTPQVLRALHLELFTKSSGLAALQIEKF